MFNKIILLVLSLSLIALVVGTLEVVAFLITITSVSYLLLLVCDQFNSSRIRLLCSHVFSAFCAISFITAQHFGVIGTLNGDTNSLVNQSALTLGLPFYMLQVIGLYIDVLVKRVPIPSLIDFQILVVYFPKFLSGPLENNQAFLARLRDFRFVYDSSRIDDGISWVLLGVLFKFCLSGPIDQFVIRDEVFDPLVILISATMLEFRLYFDLAGYSFIVYGLGKITGIEVTLNFNHPFLSRNVREFWRNWHISLGKWFHEYLYLPLRDVISNKAGTRTFLPLLVFFVSAMWHGMTFNFLLWGLFHGLVFVFFVTFLYRYDWPRWLGLLSLWAFLIFGRLLFMESDPGFLIQKLISVTSISRWSESLGNLPKLFHRYDFGVGLFFYFGIAVFIVFLESWSKNRRPDSPYHIFRTRAGFLGCIVAILLLISNDLQGFIYARQ